MKGFTPTWDNDLFGTKTRPVNSSILQHVFPLFYLPKSWPLHKFILYLCIKSNRRLFEFRFQQIWMTITIAIPIPTTILSWGSRLRSNLDWSWSFSISFWLKIDQSRLKKSKESIKRSKSQLKKLFSYKFNLFRSNSNFLT